MTKKMATTWWKTKVEYVHSKTSVIHIKRDIITKIRKQWSHFIRRYRSSHALSNKQRHNQIFCMQSPNVKFPNGRCLRESFGTGPV